MIIVWVITLFLTLMIQEPVGIFEILNSRCWRIFNSFSKASILNQSSSGVCYQKLRWIRLQKVWCWENSWLGNQRTTEYWDSIQAFKSAPPRLHGSPSSRWFSRNERRYCLSWVFTWQDQSSGTSWPCDRPLCSGGSCQSSKRSWAERRNRNGKK